MPDCIVVGGGVIGMLTARALYKAGMDVMLLERAALGGESSWAGGGIISPLYAWNYADAVNRLAERSKQLYPLLVAELLDETGIDSELLHSGLFVLNNTPVETILTWGQHWGVEIQKIEQRSQVSRIEPATASNVTHGLWLPAIMQIRNPRLVKALKGSFEHLGIACKEHTPVAEILTENNKITGVRSENESFFADKVVLASGAWTAQFGTATREISVQPVKGQMIMFHGEPGLLKTMVLAEGHYVIPRKDGHILAGSTLEKADFDKTVSVSAMTELHQAAVSLVPMLADLPVERQWAGLRPGTEQGIPYICPHPQIEGLFIHAGHYRNGIVLGAASAELMAAVVLEQNTRMDASAYQMNAEH